jgi:hypothetical protein
MLRIMLVRPLTGFKVEVELSDGTTRALDLDSSLRGPVFEELRECPDLFRKVRVEHGTLVWPTGQDLDPDVLLGTWAPNQHPPAPQIVAQFDGLTVSVEYLDLGPPTLRFDGPGVSEARVEICSGQLTSGVMPEPTLIKARHWLNQNRDSLLLVWGRYQAGLPVGEG